MKRQWMAGPAAAVLAVGLLLMGAPGAPVNAQPRRNREVGPPAVAAPRMPQPRMAPSVTRQRAAPTIPRQRATQAPILGARRTFVSPQLRGVRGTEFRHARVARFRRYYAPPYGYYYYPPPVTYYYSPPVTYYDTPPVSYYYSPYSGYYYPTSYWRRRHHRYRMRVAGYREYYTASPPGWRHGRRRGWHGHSVAPGMRRHGRR